MKKNSYPLDIDCTVDCMTDLRINILEAYDNYISGSFIQFPTDYMCVSDWNRYRKEDSDMKLFRKANLLTEDGETNGDFDDLILQVLMEDESFKAKVVERVKEYLAEKKANKA